MQEVLVTEPIDVKLFIPLSEFFAITAPDLEDMKRWASQTYDPEYGIEKFYEKRQGERKKRTFKGLAFEAYMRSLLHKFSETNGLFQPFPLPYGYLPEGCAFFRHPWDSVQLYRDGRRVSEIDSLYYLHSEEVDIPIIFESKIKRGGGVKSIVKIKMVKKIYDTDPYFCKIMPNEKDRQIGLYKISDLKNYRKFIVPDREEVSALAEWIESVT